MWQDAHTCAYVRHAYVFMQYVCFFCAVCVSAVPYHLLIVATSTVYIPVPPPKISFQSVFFSFFLSWVCLVFCFLFCYFLSSFFSLVLYLSNYNITLFYLLYTAVTT